MAKRTLYLIKHFPGLLQKAAFSISILYSLQRYVKWQL